MHGRLPRLSAAQLARIGPGPARAATPGSGEQTLGSGSHTHAHIARTPVRRQHGGMDVDLFAGIYVSDLAAAEEWYGRLLGAQPLMRPNDVEIVWELAEHRFLYVELRPQDAGHALQTLFLADYDGFLAAAAGRGVEPATVETYDNGVRKATFRDPDGNRVGIGGAPAES